jgi:glycosyltransferase involved in cell wall biosynthesis
VSDVLLVSLGSTAGLRAADAELTAAWRRAGATVAVAPAARPREVRTFALTDLAWARAARVAARAALRRERPRAVVFSSMGAALLWPEPGAVRFDAPMAGNRPGRHGPWQRPVERRRLREAPLLLPWSDGARAEAPAPRAPAVVVPVPVEPPDGPAPARDLAAITYAANPHKKGLDRVLAAWRAVARPGERLVVVGADGPPADGVAYEPLLPAARYRALLRRARVYVTAPRREDHGLAQLEALAHGCALVTTPSPGPYAALPIARALDQRLVAEDLAPALRTALDDPAPGHTERALGLLAGHLRPATDAAAAAALDRLLAGSSRPAA